MTREQAHTPSLDDPPELIAQENVPLVWPLFQSRIKTAWINLEFGESTPEQVYQWLVNGEAQLWIGNYGEMIAITRIGQYPGVRRLIVDFIEGANYEHYVEHMDYIESWAVSMGATQAEAELRPGLARFARKLGWKKRRVKMFKHLIRNVN